MIEWELLSIEEKETIFNEVAKPYTILYPDITIENIRVIMNINGYVSEPLEENYVRGKHQERFFRSHKLKPIVEGEDTRYFVACGYTMEDATKKAFLLYHGLEVYAGIKSDFFSEEQLDKATGWWGEQMCFEDEQSGPDGQYYIPTKEEIDRFRFALKHLIIRETDPLQLSFVLDVDYHPNKVIAEALHHAKIEVPAGKCIDFPQKTVMRLDRDEILVKEGYGCPFETIYKREV